MIAIMHGARLLRPGAGASIGRRLRGGALALLVPLLASCAAAPGVQAPRGVPGCEASIDLWWADPAKARFEYMRIDRGEFGWGGGIDAFDRRTTWGMTLAPADCEAIARELGSVDWTGLASRQDAVTEERAYMIIVTGKPDEHRVRVQADDASVASLRAALGRIAARRLEGTLDELPKAGQRFDQSRD
jgi:hypothetical protein